MSGKFDISVFFLIFTLQYKT